MADNKILAVSELAKHLNIHRITVYRLLKSGTLPGFKIGRLWRFDLDQITTWIQTGKAPQSFARAANATASIARAPVIPRSRPSTRGPRPARI